MEAVRVRVARSISVSVFLSLVAAVCLREVGKRDDPEKAKERKAFDRVISF